MCYTYASYGHLIYVKWIIFSWENVGVSGRYVTMIVEFEMNDNWYESFASSVGL